MHQIDVEDEKVFDPGKWIGKGKKYPSRDTPIFIFNARKDAFGVPETIQANLYPHHDVPISSFLASNFPQQSVTLITAKPHLWFDMQPPNMSLDPLLTRAVPSKEVLEQLEEIAGQEWFNGKQSICDPRFNNRQDRFPLYAIGFWKDMVRIQAARKAWEETHRIVHAHLGEYKVAVAAQTLLTNIGWNQPIKTSTVQTNTPELARIIGSTGVTQHKPGWLSDSIVDLMVDTLKERMESELSKARLNSTMVSHVGIMHELTRASRSKTYTRKEFPMLFKIAGRVWDNGLRELYFPVFVNGCHWLAVCIDFDNNCIRYGDSNHIFPVAATKELSIIQKWTEKAFTTRFVVKERNSLLHGSQLDASSCGLFAINSIEHAILHDILLVPERVTYYRLSWFVKLANTYGLQPVRATDLLNPTENDLDTSSCPSSPPLTTRSVSPQLSMETSDAVSLMSTNDDLPSRTTEAQPAEAKLGKQTYARKPIKNILSFFSRSKPSVPSSSSQSKRARSTSPSIPETSSLGSSDHVSRVEIKRRKTKNTDSDLVSKPVGMSRSAIAAREIREQVKNGTYKATPAQIVKWKKKCRGVDIDCEFRKDDYTHVQCSKCLEWYCVSDPCAVPPFRKHFKECQTSGMQRIDNLFTKKLGATKLLGINNVLLPCPGLEGTKYPLVDQYLKRTQFVGGGGRGLDRIAEELYGTGTVYSELTEREKEVVRDMQIAGHRWRNEHQRGRVFATDCKEDVVVQLKVRGSLAAEASRAQLQTRKPCASCAALLRDQDFIRLSKREIPKNANFKFVPKLFRDPILGELYAKCHGLKELLDEQSSEGGTQSALTRYAIGVAQGKYKDNKILSGLIQSMVNVNEREQQGKGKQNMDWSPAWSTFVHALEIESPAAYRIVQEHLPAPTRRSFAGLRAKQPAFPMEIGDRTFQLVETHLQQLGYNGPVALSCDDTKLCSALRMCWSKEENCILLVGAIGGALRVADAEEARKLVNSTSNSLATKVRLFTAQVPLPGVAPILVSALPIGDSNKAEELVQYSLKIIRGLIHLGIRVTSYSCDGTAVERQVQKLLCSMADEVRTHTIPGPHTESTGLYDLVLTIAVFDGCPVVMVQDSKHGLKTFRNNLFSGARMLVLGQEPALYRHIQEMAADPDTPLYQRDVYDTDKQDDNAAIRLFSSGALGHLTEKHPESLGDIVYLFVFGELIDAYQNRHISLAERLQILLRTHYFVCMWRRFLDICGYSSSQFFISRDATDICRILIEGLAALIFVYRDDYPTFPLLPWLHSSEPCEHVFGSARQIVKDFTMLDFYYMVQKISVKVRNEFVLAKASDPRGRANGYNHTYLDSKDLNLPALMDHVDNSEIPSIARAAMEEAESLIGMLGLEPASVHDTQAVQHLPSIASWLSTDADEDEDDLDNEEDDDDPYDVAGSMSLRRALHDIEPDLCTNLLPHSTTTRLGNLASAAAALTLDDMRAAYVTYLCLRVFVVTDFFPNSEAELGECELTENHYAMLQEAEVIGTVLSRALPPLQLEDEPERPFGKGMIGLSQVDLSPLVRIRQRHETRQAIFGVRVQSQKQKQDVEVVTRRQLLSEIQQVLKESKGERTTTGLERATRWLEGGEKNAGNSANAKAAAASTVSKVV
ncbi:hypothetical protein K474DRAFT_1609629 [Panus rudis PR-1116 ss-1]|nr:hypothetical protein K474DRAFT_1609629 [Panus rudis PR-1116 ss-1]